MKWVEFAGQSTRKGSYAENGSGSQNRGVLEVVGEY